MSPSEAVDLLHTALRRLPLSSSTPIRQALAEMNRADLDLLGEELAAEIELLTPDGDPYC